MKNILMGHTTHRVRWKTNILTCSFKFIDSFYELHTSHTASTFDTHRKHFTVSMLYASLVNALHLARVSLAFCVQRCLVDYSQVFVAAVFYIGKGQRGRPYAHFYEALSAGKPAPEIKHQTPRKAAKKGVSSRPTHLRCQ